jgi:hypothetical protein
MATASSNQAQGQSFCDWCYVQLTDSDRAEVFNQYLNRVGAYACSHCIRGGHVLQPPDGLEVDDEQRAAWEAGAVAIYDGQAEDRILPLLCKATGFEPDDLGTIVVFQDRLWARRSPPGGIPSQRRWAANGSSTSNGQMFRARRARHPPRADSPMVVSQPVSRCRYPGRSDDPVEGRRRSDNGHLPRNGPYDFHALEGFEALSGEQIAPFRACRYGAWSGRP